MFKNNLFAERIKQSRLEKNLTQLQLANMLNVTKTAISDIERSRRTTTIEKLYEISVCLEVSTDYLLGISNIPTIKQ